ncbi:unnamed protein product [Blepharisma stoltei]|uniref:Uncharacterized protein n=1 Tax=Blepharisma stoltei TaxID=1481888 RepID=A0AAU9JZ63_9CILI|nr:unnamed protein product [Blepharisma stoltei]
MEPDPKKLGESLEIAMREGNFTEALKLIDALQSTGAEVKFKMVPKMRQKIPSAPIQKRPANKEPQKIDPPPSNGLLENYPWNNQPKIPKKNDIHEKIPPQKINDPQNNLQQIPPQKINDPQNNLQQIPPPPLNKVYNPPPNLAQNFQPVNIAEALDSGLPDLPYGLHQINPMAIPKAFFRPPEPLRNPEPPGPGIFPKAPPVPPSPSYHDPNLMPRFSEPALYRPFEPAIFPRPSEPIWPQKAPDLNRQPNPAIFPKAPEPAQKSFEPIKPIKPPPNLLVQNNTLIIPQQKNPGPQDFFQNFEHPQAKLANINIPNEIEIPEADNPSPNKYLDDSPEARMKKLQENTEKIYKTLLEWGCDEEKARKISKQVSTIEAAGEKYFG